MPRSLAAALVLFLAGSLAAVALGATPISSSGTTSLPAFRGHAATAHRIVVPRTPQNPFMASNDDSNVHNNAWQTDAYDRLGPLGRSPQVFSTTLENHVCITLTFDTRGRLVASCISITTGPRLYMLDPKTLNVLATFDLPFKPPPPGIPPTTNTTGGAYFYLDNHDRAVLATTDRRIWIVAETGGIAHPGFKRVRSYDIGPLLKPDERLPSVLPDWKGRLWFIGRQNGTVGVIDPKTGKGKSIHTGEQIENSFATAQDGVYVVTDKAMYRFVLGRGGVPSVVWRARYPNDGKQKVGQFTPGSGTTPTIMPGGFVTITDNADPLDVVVYRNAAKLKKGQKREVCRVPIFHHGASSDENSLIVAGRSIIAENNSGYDLAKTSGGKLTSPGIVRIDVNKQGTGCRVVWRNNTERVPSAVSKLSLRSGLVYTYTKDRDPANPTTDVWSWTALDFRTGKTVWKRIAGTGTNYNNHYAGIAIGPTRRMYLGGIGGIMGLRDR